MKIESDLEYAKAEIEWLKQCLEIQNANCPDRATLPGIAGSKKVFQVFITTERGCDIEEGEYGVTIINMFDSFIESGDFELIEEAVAEVIGDLTLPEEGQTPFIVYEAGEREDVFWNKYYLVKMEEAK